MDENTMNAKKEILEHIGNKAVKFVEVRRISYWLPKEIFRGTIEEVIEHLDFEYDDSYGSQEIDGVIWYEDGTWSDRRDYDGSEWWEHQVCPSIPNPEGRDGEAVP